MADYGCWPLWSLGPDPSKIGPINPEVLPLSRGLTDRLLKWAEIFDRQLNLQDPCDVFKAPEWTPEDVRWFEEEGWELWIQLRAELGAAYQVFYFFRGKVVDDPTSLPSKFAE
jgi:hypothetical protein